MTPEAVKIELPGIEKFKSGKVREVYDQGDQYLPAVLYSNANSPSDSVSIWIAMRT
ncbi:hypothetical protein P4B35_11035 [Pontiellaceae bacterium B12227]|nr:hypothetical protein [Pontiellaceae bacterium B12227]